MSSRMENEISSVADITDRAFVGSESKCPLSSYQRKEPDRKEELECDSTVPANPAASISNSVTLNDCHTGLTQEMEDLVLSEKSVRADQEDSRLEDDKTAINIVETFVDDEAFEDQPWREVYNRLDILSESTIRENELELSK